MTEIEWLQSEDAKAMLDWALVADAIRDGSHWKRLDCSGFVQMPIISEIQLRLFGFNLWLSQALRHRDVAPELLGHVTEDLAWIERPGPINDRWMLHTLTPQQFAMEAIDAYTLSGLRPVQFRTSATVKRVSDIEAANMLRDIVGNPWVRVELPEAHCGPDRIAVNEFSGMNPEQFRAALRRRGWLRCPWLTEKVMALAHAAHDNRDEHGFLENDRLLILGDALEEQGCYAQENCPSCYGKGKVTVQSADAAWIRSFAYETECGTCKGKGQVDFPLLEHLRSRGPHVSGCWAVMLCRQHRGYDGDLPSRQ